MKTNMTERDKKLLVGMLIGVIIVAIGYWGIIPQIKAFNELETKIEKEEDTQKINKLKIQNTPLIEMQAEEYEEKLASVKDDFYPIMNSAKIDEMMTGLATKYGLNIYELKFSMPVGPTERKAYINSRLYQQQLTLMQEYQDALEAEESSSSKSSSKANSTEASTDGSSSSSKSSTTTSSKGTQEVMNAITGAEEGGYQPNTQVYAVPITFTVGGEVSKLEDFLEEMGQLEKTALLSSYTWGEYRTYVIRDANGNIISTNGIATTADGTGVNVDDLVEDTTIRKSLTIRLELYMCDTSVVEESEGENAEGTETAAE